MYYKNRYNDVFTFTEDENHDVLWEGNFEYCRIGMPNDYTKAYEAYCLNTRRPISLESFKDIVHKYDDKNHKYLYDKYINLVKCLKDEIDMIDPSGGPYITREMELDSFGFKDYVVKNFEKIETGYKIITDKCSMCHLPGKTHKMGCETQIVTVFYDQMEKEVHKNNSNLNQ